jgi:hypothetical protein
VIILTGSTGSSSIKACVSTLSSPARLLNIVESSRYLTLSTPPLSNQS